MKRICQTLLLLSVLLLPSVSTAQVRFDGAPKSSLMPKAAAALEAALEPMPDPG